jgi:hypothetical protein
MIHALGFLDPLWGTGYQFWSGIGSDFGEVTILVACISFYRHVNCGVTGCKRLGHRVEGSGHRACKRHHPRMSTGTVTEADIAKHHRRRAV